MRAETVHQLILLALVAGLGFSLFAGYEVANPGVQGVCTLGSYVSCAKIDTSGHTTTLGVQDWVWGVVGFVAMLALDVPLYWTWKHSYLLALTGLSALGGLLSVYFAYVELVVIQGLCIICLGAYLTNAVALAGLVYLVRLSQTAEPGRSTAGTPSS